jgi:hypothetical protein
VEFTTAQFVELVLINLISKGAVFREFVAEELWLNLRGVFIHHKMAYGRVIFQRFLLIPKTKG